MISSRHRTALTWLLLTLLFLLLAASRLTRLHELRMNPDEIWSVWQTFGTFQQIIQWTPYDWPPLYYLILGGWWRLTSLYPQILRLLSVLVFMLGSACIYRLMAGWRGRWAGGLAALSYAALGYGILLSIEVRGYALLLGLMPLALWWTERYFTHRRWLYGVLLALLLTAMFCISYTSASAIIMLGLYTLIVYRREVWRWWLPGGLTALLTLPEIMQIRATAVDRIAATQTLTPGPLPEALYNIFWNWAGPLLLPWFLMLLVAMIFMFVKARRLERHALALGIWALMIPVLLYLTNPLTGFFSARYAWWVMIGLALWLAWCLSYLPRLASAGASVLLIVMLFYPLPVDQYSIWGSSISPLGDNFTFMRGHIRWGDVLLADPRNQCGAAEEWDYYVQTYFPDGLHFISDPTNHRRVWYVLQAGREDETLVTALQRQHILRFQVGPARCVFMLYEAPPDVIGIAFENGLRFHGMDMMQADARLRSEPLVSREGETLRLRLWWSVDAPLPVNYEVSVTVGSLARVIGQSQSIPQIYYPPLPPPTMDGWQPEGYYIEEREVRLRNSVRSGLYTIFLSVHDGDYTVSISGADEAGRLPIGQLTVKSY